MLKKKLHDRFNWHRNEFNQPGKCDICRILSDHFLKDVCCNSSYSLQIQKKSERNGSTSRNASDTPITSRRKQREKIRKLKLRAIYPYSIKQGRMIKRGYSCAFRQKNLYFYLEIPQ